MAVVLDTSFLVDLEHERPAALTAWRRLVESRETMFVPTPALAEYLTGVPNPDKGAEYLRGSTQFLIFGEAESLAAAALARRAYREGKFPGWNDIMIAACAKEKGDLEIVSANSNDFPFSRVREY